MTEWTPTDRHIVVLILVVVVMLGLRCDRGYRYCRARGGPTWYCIGK